MSKTITITFTQGDKTIKQWKDLWLKDSGLFSAGYVDLECWVAQITQEKMMCAIEYGKCSFTYDAELYDALVAAIGEAEQEDEYCNFILETSP
jgi:hypothetical protein